ncbi:MAG: hypothetical protein SV775_07920 [Thermodesulfobacteriota bacterium]|nr:hypothetical protein [Thermodesulfobacteriota bacterium]
MNKKIAVFIAFMVVTATVVLFFKTTWVRHILVLKNGTIFVAEDIWTDGDSVFFRKNNEIGAVKAKEIRHIAESGYRIPAELKKDIISYLTTTKEKLGVFSHMDTGRPWLRTFWTGFDSSVYGFWLVALLALSVGGLIALVIVRYVKASRAADSKTGKAILGAYGNTATVSSPVQPVLTHIQAVEMFFLNLFRHQLGATEDAPRKIVRIPGQDSGPKRVYELQVKWRNEKKSRRMTISPLGEGSGSKSQCFYVIYDTHLVVKIPPLPIIDFQDYIRRIREETSIVSKLAPTECIIPNISVILQMVKTLPHADGLSPKALENKYTYWLEAHPESQSFLKVGGAFAFFMDLSKYYFLSHVMDSLHDVDTEIRKEIAEDGDLILDYHGFGNKYDSNGDQLCGDLQRIYSQFDRELRRLSPTPENAKHLPEKLKKEWFLSHMVGTDFGGQQWGLSARLVERTNSLLNTLSDENSSVAGTYQRLVRERISQTLFARNKLKMGGVITNLIVLLDWLGTRMISMRDLKPDNLLVAGDPANYPLFLETAGDYSIGLIDVETAVDCEDMKSPELSQPQLGGTPLYATPSHFFENNLLKDMYKSLPLILHLQDWYAVAGIIYQVVTGNKLFSNTATQIPKIMQTIGQLLEQERKLAEIYKYISSVFWNAAGNEFELKINSRERQLKSIYVEIPAKMEQWFKGYLVPKKREIQRQMKARILTQDIFKNEKQRQGLFRCSHKDILRLKKKYEGLSRADKTPAVDTGRITKLFEDLCEHKLRAERLSKIMSSLENDVPVLPAYDVLKIMFGIVVGSMHHTQWEETALSHAQDGPRDSSPAGEIPEDLERTLGFTVTIRHRT